MLVTSHRGEASKAQGRHVSTKSGPKFLLESTSFVMFLLEKLQSMDVLKIVV